MKKNELYISNIRENLKPFLHISRYIYKHGGLAVFVGGIIRSILVGDFVKDCDIESYFLDKLMLKQILSKEFKIVFVGISFGVFKICNMNVDISLPRTEKCIGKKHTDFEISINCFNSYKQSAFRRDFTINSIGYIDEYELLLDPFNGIQDIYDKKIRPINVDNFIEDPLRFLRAIYFAEKLEFEFSNCMESVFNEYCNNVKYVSHTRIAQEFEKILQSKRIKNSFYYLSKIQIENFNFIRYLYYSREYHNIVNSLNRVVYLETRIVILYFYMKILKINYKHLDNIIHIGSVLKNKAIKNYYILSDIMSEIIVTKPKLDCFNSLFTIIIDKYNLNTIKHVRKQTIILFLEFNNTYLNFQDLENIFYLCENLKKSTYFSNILRTYKIKSLDITEYYVYYYLCIFYQSYTFDNIFAKRNILQNIFFVSLQTVKKINLIDETLDNFIFDI